MLFREGDREGVKYSGLAKFPLHYGWKGSAPSGKKYRKFLGRPKSPPFHREGAQGWPVSSDEALKKAGGGGSP